MPGAICMHSAIYFHPAEEKKKRKFQMSTHIWLSWPNAGLQEIVPSMWGRFSDKKMCIGSEQNTVVQKVFHVTSKIRLKQ